ncbi:MAG TPA: insulinase family protein, partial [Bacteroidales bacterium]|nr:insulinase family protein [Bacteroidales bacterium]
LLWVFFLGGVLFAEGMLLTGNTLPTGSAFSTRSVLSSRGALYLKSVLTKGSSVPFSQPANLSAPLPVDDEYLIGTLDNGLTYYIREATNPRGRAEFFIVHNVGSLQEEDDQRGLAHFLEHMAFNGTKNFPGKSLLEYFGSIGVKFGANINAYTSMDRTVYNISDVPVDRSSVVDSALLALHDWSHYITCDAEELEKERGVVREEWRRGDVSATRMMKAISRFQQTGSRFAERDVIGLPSVIDTFERQTLIDYYHRWYRPDLQAVIVVGDIDKTEMEQRIIRTFSTIPAVKDAPVRQTYDVPDNKEPIVGYFTDPETSAISTRITIKIPPLTHEEKQSDLYLYEELLDKVFLEMMRNRFRVAATNPEAPFRTVIPVFSTISYASKLFTSTAIPVEDEETFETLEVVQEEIDDLVAEGPTEQEVQEIKLYLEKRFTDRKKNVSWMAILSSALKGEPNLELEQLELLEQVNARKVHTFAKRLFESGNRMTFVFEPL